MGNHKFDRIALRDAVLTLDRKRMVCIGAMVSAPDGSKPMKSPNENQILGVKLTPFVSHLSNDTLRLVYNLEERKIEKYVHLYSRNLTY